MTTCPYCDGGLSAVGERLGFTVGVCAGCGSLACLDDVGEDVLADLYGDPGYYTGGRPPYGYDGDLDRNDVQRTPVWEQRLHALAALTGGRRLLELGPGRGGFLRLAEARGWEVVAVDPYPAAGLAATVHPRLEEAATDGPFDAVCLFDVLEHVLRPGDLLGGVVGILAPGGAVAVGLPNLDGPSFRAQGVAWAEVKPPEHLSLPTAAGMRAVAGQAGLRVVTVLGHFAETWLWEPMRPYIDPRRSTGALGAATVFGARVLNRGVREVRTRLPAPPPERQDYVTWLLARA